MCMEDIRIGRHTGTNSRLLTIAAATATKVMEMDQMRIAIVFAVPSGATATIGPKSAQPTATAGIGLNGNTTPVKFNMDDIGREVQSEWWIYWTAGGTLTIIETSLEKE